MFGENMSSDELSQLSIHIFSTFWGFVSNYRVGSDSWGGVVSGNFSAKVGTFLQNFRELVLHDHSVISWQIFVSEHWWPTLWLMVTGSGKSTWIFQDLARIWHTQRRNLDDLSDARSPRLDGHFLGNWCPGTLLIHTLPSGNQIWQIPRGISNSGKSWCDIRYEIPM